ncbi:MAG: hypothetical protein V2I33_08755 [Kangiellaceae bacterium]|nr:hypothetical protein [Kangiellaceae bacterium]
MASHHIILSELLPHQYLPSAGNMVDASLAWSVSLNMAVWLTVTTSIEQVVRVKLSFEDSRGENLLEVDSQQVTGQQQLVFSNLVKVPIKGAIKNVKILIGYPLEPLQCSLDELFIQAVDNQYRLTINKTAV